MQRKLEIYQNLFKWYDRRWRYTYTIFSNTICCAISICSCFSSEDSSMGISSTYLLFPVTWHGNFPVMTFEWHVLHMYCFTLNDCWILKYIWQGYFLFMHVITDFFIKYLITDSTYKIRAFSYFPLNLVNTQFNPSGFH